MVGLAAGALLLAPAPASAEESNTWSVTGAPVQALGYQTATTLEDGRVLATGGQGALAELYRPSSGAWQAAASMKRSRTLATATLLPDGKVLVAGGFNGTTVEATAELYDPATDQ